MSLSTEYLRSILEELQSKHTPVTGFVLSLISATELADHPAVQELFRDLPILLSGFVANDQTAKLTKRWACDYVKATCASEVTALVQKQTGLHFNARGATNTQLETFAISEIAKTMLTVAPRLWDMTGVLLEANPALGRRDGNIRSGHDYGGPDLDMSSINSDEYWKDEFDLPDVEMESGETRGVAQGPASASDSEDEYWRHKKVVCISIMMQSTHQRCNALQSMVGIFLHSCNAPEAIVELLSRIGISVSRSAIDDAISSLSREAASDIKELGRTCCTAYAYDNFDVDIKHVTPTVEKPQDTLLHLTSGTLLRLDHGVTTEDLQCSEELWKKSDVNPANHRRIHGIDWTQFINLHPEPLHPSNLTRRQCFNRWKFLHDLITHGPEYFRRFANVLEEPEAIDQIPLVKSRQVPAESMDINQSSVSGNSDALSNLFRQGGVGDPNETPGCTDIGNHVILVHGDLGTCERVQSLLQSRAEERTPWRRFQFVVFVMGLFHLKMAATDALWKIFIFPKAARADDTSLMKMVAEIRPKETSKIASKPGFRRMHEVVQHVGIVS
ncbi:hypothetical protein B0H21DRAFT_702085 [Amylocystis lapponica]|nr:hypothetical protein B0H21DRAFT_702085 [Amylocystis lapponica]